MQLLYDLDENGNTLSVSVININKVDWKSSEDKAKLGFYSRYSGSLCQFDWGKNPSFSLFSLSLSLKQIQCIWKQKEQTFFFFRKGA